MCTLSRPTEEKVSDLIYFKIYFPLNICATMEKTLAISLLSGKLRKNYQTIFKGGLKNVILFESPVI